MGTPMANSSEAHGATAARGGDHAHLIARESGRPLEYRPVETDGAVRAAARIAELI
jgi:hypothetical protein